MACLEIEGKNPFLRELLIIDKILGPTVSIASLRNFVGIASRLHVVGFIWAMISDKNDSDIGLN